MRQVEANSMNGTLDFIKNWSLKNTHTGRPLMCLKQECIVFRFLVWNTHYGNCEDKLEGDKSRCGDKLKLLHHSRQRWAQHKFRCCSWRYNREMCEITCQDKVMDWLYMVKEMDTAKMTPRLELQNWMVIVPFTEGNVREGPGLLGKKAWLWL